MLEADIAQSQHAVRQWRPNATRIAWYAAVEFIEAGGRKWERATEGVPDAPCCRASSKWTVIRVEKKWTETSSVSGSAGQKNT